MTGYNISGTIQSYLDTNFSHILSLYLQNQSGYIEKSILQNQQLLQLQNSNIDFWYNHIQTILGRMAVIGIMLFIGSYGYIWQQAKRTINQIKEEKKELEKKYSELLTKTDIDIKEIKDDNEFQILLMKGLSLKANKKWDDALDHYDNMISQQFIQQDNDKKYGVYKEMTDAHYLLGENSEQTYENASNYFNALDSLEKAMEIYIKEEDEILKGTLQDKYNKLNELEPSES